MKIDGSLVEGLTTPGGKSRSTVQMIVEYCRPIGICTVAEEVESVEQVKILRELGVDTAQGYFFSPPLSGSDAADLAATVAHPDSRSVPKPVVQ
jgi:EAL domain-containing protein (putative c-di-GMP-specific phosphodiesterase class I)